METNNLVTYFFVTSVCSAAYIPDDKLNTLKPSHETSVSEKQISLLPAKTRSKQPFPLNNLNSCNAKSDDDKGPLNSLLGGLLPSLLSILSKNQNSPSGNGYNKNCENDQRNFKDTQDSLKTNSKGVNENPLDSTSETQEPVRNDDDDDSIIDMNNHDANEINSDDSDENVELNNPASDIDADTDVLNGDELEENAHPNDPVSDVLNGDDSEKNAQPNNSASDVDADVLNGERLMNKDMLENPSKVLENRIETQEEYLTGKAFIATDAESKSRQNVNLRSCESCKRNDGEHTGRQGSLVDVEVLNGDDNENHSDEESSETQSPLVEVDALNGEENSLMDTLGGVLGRSGNNVKAITKSLAGERSKVDISDFKIKNEETYLDSIKDIPERAAKHKKGDDNTGERNNESLLEKTKIMKKEDPNKKSSILSQNNLDKYKNYHTNTLNKNKVEITGRKRNMHHTTVESDEEGFYRVRITKNEDKNYDHKEENEKLKNLKATNFKLRDENGIRDEFIKTVKTENTLEMYKTNSDSTTQSFSNNYNDNQFKTLISSQPMLPASEKSYFAYTNQQFGNINHDYERASKRFWPYIFIYTNQLFPGTNKFSKTPEEWNIEYQNFYYVPPHNNIAYRAGTHSKRNPLFRIFSQLEYPTIPQYPQSVAGSNLYGSYAFAQTMPGNRYGNNGLVGGTGLPLGGLGNSVGGQTSVEETQTSVEQVSTSQGVDSSQMGVIGGPI